MEKEPGQRQNREGISTDLGSEVRREHVRVLQVPESGETHTRDTHKHETTAMARYVGRRAHEWILVMTYGTK